MDLIEIQKPPIEADVNVQTCAFMPLDVASLLGSIFYAESTGDEFKAGISLWCRSWHQKPAGSLPDNDKTLAQMAGYGRDVDGWLAVKAVALRGYKRCIADKRLYHQLIVDKALVAFYEREQSRSAGRAGAEKRWGKGKKSDPNQPKFGFDGDSDPNGDANSDPNGDAIGSPVATPMGSGMASKGKLREGESSKENPERAGRARGTRLTPDWKPTDRERMFAKSRGLNSTEVETEILKFRNHWLAKSDRTAVKSDWERTWQNWVITAAEMRGRKPNHHGQSGTDTKVVFALPQHGEAITNEMCPHQIYKRHVGKVFVKNDSDEWHAWLFHLGELARAKNVAPPIVEAAFQGGWSFPSRWPPEGIQYKAAASEHTQAGVN